MKAFRVSGQFTMGHITSPFTIETIAADAEGAKDRVLATLGSRHRVNRHQVTIKEAVEFKAADAADLTIVKRLSMVK